MDSIYDMPGMIPASAIPKKVRATVIPTKFWQNARHMVMSPKMNVINASHILGPNFLQRILVGLITIKII